MEATWSEGGCSNTCCYREQGAAGNARYTFNKSDFHSTNLICDIRLESRLAGSSRSSASPWLTTELAALQVRLGRPGQDVARTSLAEAHCQLVPGREASGGAQSGVGVHRGEPHEGGHRPEPDSET